MDTEACGHCGLWTLRLVDTEASVFYVVKSGEDFDLSVTYGFLNTLNCSCWSVYGGSMCLLSEYLHYYCFHYLYVNGKLGVDGGYEADVQRRKKSVHFKCYSLQ